MKAIGRRLAGVLLAATLALWVPGAATASATRPRTPAAPMRVTKAVKIINFAFIPKLLTIKKGTAVKWTNRGSVMHTTTSNKGLWNSHPLATGKSFTHVFTKVGTFAYHCNIHPFMTGTIKVTA